MFKKLNNSRYTLISLYIVVVATIIIGVYFFVDNFSYFFDLAMGKISWVLHAARPIIFALIFTYILDPIVVKVESLFAKIKFFKNRFKTRKVICVMIVMLLFISIISALISVLIYSITKQLKLANLKDLAVIAQAYLNNLNKLYDSAIKWLDNVNFRSEELKTYLYNIIMVILEKLKTGSGSIVSAIGGISTLITQLFISLVITTYLLIDSDKIIQLSSKVSKALLSKKADKKIKRFMNDANYIFSGYIRGQSADAFVMLILISTGLSIIGVKFGVLIGIIAGIGNLIPYVGPIIAYGGVAIVSLLTGEWTKFLVAIIFLIVIQIIDANIIGPKLLSNSISVHPIVVICSIVFGNALGGFLGMLLAVPVGALFTMLFLRFIDEKVEMKNKMEMEEMEDFQNNNNVDDYTSESENSDIINANEDID